MFQNFKYHLPSENTQEFEQFISFLVCKISSIYYTQTNHIVRPFNIRQFMKEYIGDLRQYLIVQYAKSNRSTCRKCKQKIYKNQLRLGIHFDDDKFSTDNWFHLNCFEFKPRHRILNIENVGNHIFGIQDLSSIHYQNLIQILKNDFKQLQKRKFNIKRKKSFEKHRKYDLTEQQKLSKNQETEQRKQEGKKYIKKPRKKPVTHQVISKSQKNQYQRLIRHYQSLTARSLKQILEKNKQTKVGHKQELAARCADGKQFGRIPPCAKCGGGHLRFDREKGFYYCPGYMQDTDFVHCDGKFNFEDVKREKWQE